MATSVLSSSTVARTTTTSHSTAVSVFFNDGADLVLECSTSEQVVVEDFSFLLMSFQFFFELGDGMRDEGVIAKNH